jgi:hypothetical protein
VIIWEKNRGESLWKKDVRVKKETGDGRKGRG